MVIQYLNRGVTTIRSAMSWVLNKSIKFYVVTTPSVVTYAATVIGELNQILLERKMDPVLVTDQHEAQKEAELARDTAFKRKLQENKLVDMVVEEWCKFAVYKAPLSDEYVKLLKNKARELVVAQRLIFEELNAETKNVTEKTCTKVS